MFWGFEGVYPLLSNKVKTFKSDKFQIYRTIKTPNIKLIFILKI